MSVRRRLQQEIEARRLREVCWRCALRSSRHISAIALHSHEGPDSWQAVEELQIKEVFPGLPEPGKSRIINHDVLQVTKSTHCIEAHAGKGVKTTILPQRTIKSEARTFDEALPPSAVGSCATRNATHNFNWRSKVGQVDSSLYRWTLRPKPKRRRSLSFHDKPLKHKKSPGVGHKEQLSSGLSSRRVASEDNPQENSGNSIGELHRMVGNLHQFPKPDYRGIRRLPRAYSKITRSSPPDTVQFRPMAIPSFGILTGASSTTVLQRCYIRHASTSATQFTAMDQNLLLAAASVPQPHSQLPSQPIREHLKEWRLMHGNEAQSGLIKPVGSQNLSDGEFNTVTQSRGTGENLAELSHEEALDIEYQLNANSEDNIPEIINPHLYLRRGDLVDLQIGHGSILGIFINETNNIAQIYTERGAWRQIPSMAISFSIPGIIKPSRLSALMQYLPSNATDQGMSKSSSFASSVPRDIGSHLIEAMVNFLRASEAVYREHADRLNRAYDILSHGQCKSQLSVSLEDAAIQILQKQHTSDLTPPMLLIVHRVLSHDPNISREGKLHRMIPHFKTLPQRNLAKANNVRNWSRLYQDNMVNEAMKSPFDNVDPSLEVSTNPIAAFAAKARRIVALNRQDRPLSSVGSIGRSLTKIALDEQNSTTWKASKENQESFDHYDQQIISFLDTWAASSQLNKSSNLHSLGPTILRATGLYEGFYLGRLTAFTLLQELGVIKPWDRYTLFKNNLGLPGHDPNHPATILQGQAHESLSHLPLPLHDSMAGFRKAWGNRTVFCIDSKNTLLRDDGLSLEHVDGDPSSCWVHVHVANPSAFLSKDSPVTLFARHATASVYFPEHMYPMMDPELSQKHFGLANGRPCITFSAKISSEGDILEKNITHGIVNDVRHLNLEQVMQAMASSGYKAPDLDQVPLLRVGSSQESIPATSKASPTNQEATSGLDELDVETLRTLQTISKALHQRRQRAGAVNAGDFNQSAAPSVYISATESSVATVQNDQSLQVFGDPIISINPVSRAAGDMQDMVAEFMILAGQVCGLWCSERNIPVPYRGMVRNPEAEPSPEFYRAAVLDPMTASRGHVDQRTWFTYMGLLGKAYVSASPLEHAALGIPMYCKSTSPLRRFGDLFLHWQIEAALRYEHTTGTSLVDSRPAAHDQTDVLPFSHEEVEAAARQVWHQEKKIRGASLAASDYWMTEAFYRAFYFKEAPLPAVFEFVVSTLPGNGFLWTGGTLTGWGKKARINIDDVSEEAGGYRLNDVWEAKIATVIPYLSSVILDPVRLVHRAPSN